MLAATARTWIALHALSLRLPAVGVAALALGTALFLTLTANAAFWRALFALASFGSAHDFLFVGSVFALLVAALSLLVLLFGFPYLMKAVVIVLLLVAAICAHFMDSYGVVIDEDMIRNTFETDSQEALGLLTFALVLRVVLTGILPALFVAWLPLRFGSLGEETRRRGVALAACVAVAAVALLGSYKQITLMGREHRELRLLLNPTTPLASVLSFFRGERGAVAVEPIALDARRVSFARAAPRPKLVVLVVGETARAQNFSLNGYARVTNPRLAAAPIVDFPHVSACGTSTATSLPCMFSPFGRAGYSKDSARSHENLLDVLARVGVDVRWDDNNSGCKGVCDRLPMQRESRRRERLLCGDEGCYDDVLLSALRAQLDSLTGDAFVVLHQNGSHGPAYHERTPPAFKRFAPECTRADVEHCEREAIVNAYDNTILYTDFVLSRLIALLESASGRFDVAMLYVSDHGESLGEGGLYLHGLPWMLAPREQTHVPMLVWLSDGFSTGRGIDRACLEQRRNESHSHDHLFHSVLGLFDVATRIYEPELDLFQPCRAPVPRLLSER